MQMILRKLVAFVVALAVLMFPTMAQAQSGLEGYLIPAASSCGPVCWVVVITALGVTYWFVEYGQYYIYSNPPDVRDPVIWEIPASDAIA